MNACVRSVDIFLTLAAFFLFVFVDHLLFVLVEIRVWLGLFLDNLFFLKRDIVSTGVPVLLVVEQVLNLVANS